MKPWFASRGKGTGVPMGFGTYPLVIQGAARCVGAASLAKAGFVS
jgi:hypothetical protein